MGRTMLLGVLRMPKELLTDDDPVDKIQRHSRYLEAANVIEEQDKDIETYLERMQLQEEELIRLKSVEASFNQMIKSMKDMVRHGHYSSQALNTLMESLPPKTLGDNVTNDGLNQDQLVNYYIRQGADSKPREGLGPKGLDKGLPKNEFGPSMDSPTIAQRYEVFSEEECERNSAHEPAKEEGQSTDSGENAPSSIRASWNSEVTHEDLASSADDSGTTCSE
ncbi:hypothetical protein ACQKQC_06055 [Vibrio fortis]|uniref:hypothetical protein n=1 Tax=Vibrio fortis TaxID=212667 RepID=UPI004068CB04